MKRLSIFLIIMLVAFTMLSCSTNEVVTDDLGYEVMMDAPPKRIVSLTPNITEILFHLGLGDRVVGRTSYCDYPPEADDIPSLGDIMNLSVESILELEPDLVLANRMVPLELIDQLKGISSRRINVAAFDPASIEGVVSTIDRIAVICGVKSNTNELVKQMNELKKAQTSSLVYFEIWGEPPTTFGKTTFGADIIRWAGAENLGDQIAGDYPTTTHESIISLNPNYIIIPNSYAETPDDIASRPGYSEIDAIKEGNIVTIDGDIIMRPGPRMVEALTRLIEIIQN